MLLVPTLAQAQPGDIDLNQYYRFPVSVSAAYGALTPFGDLGDNFSAFKIDLGVAVPIPQRPQLRPMAAFALTQFDDAINLDRGARRDDA